MKLYLCEKPSQARDIARVLGAKSKGDGCLRGADTVVSWCYGHLLEMSPPDAYGPAYKRWSFETLPIVPQQWQLTVKKSAAKQFRAVKALIKQADHVVIATDADREGETIAREVLELCRWRGPTSRLWLSALDDASIRKALANLLPGDKTEPLYRAGLGRARADWLVGMNLTRAYTLTGRCHGHDGVLSVGRVQTPTLNLIVQRDLEIEAFTPTPYFEVNTDVQADDKCFKAKWLPARSAAASTQRPPWLDGEGRCLDPAVARRVAQQIEGKPGSVSKAETKRERKAAPLPFELSSLQQAASKRWGMGAQEVLDCAQALYEKHKAITYPRTDCPYLPNAQFSEVGKVLATLKQSVPAYGELIDNADARLRSKAWNDKKITAHHGIIPTAAKVNTSRMTEREKRIYDMICRRYLAQFYPAYESDKTIIELIVEGHTLRATGSVPRIKGWRTVLGYGDRKKGAEDEQLLPAVSKGDPLHIQAARFESKQTKPPARFTEGTLIAAMKSVGRQIEDARLKKVLRETSGIGTEATRANIIETLLQRDYIRREQKNLISTATGRALITLLPEPIKNPVTTAVWEQALEDIAQNSGDLERFIEGQTQWLGEILRRAGESANSPSANHANAAPLFEASKQSRKCPECGRPMKRRKGKNGFFWGCTAYPKCSATLPDRRVGSSKVRAFKRRGAGR